MKTYLARVIFFVLLCSGNSVLLYGKPGGDTTILFVSLKGNDHNTGSILKPFGTIAAAANALRSLPRKRAAVIYVRSGTYHFNNAVEFSGQDSLYHITISNYKQEKVLLSGGASIDNNSIHLIKDEAILRRLPVESRGHVYEIDLFKNGVKNFGKMQKHGFATPANPAPLEFFFNEKPMVVARWPNQGTVKIGKVHDHGSVPRNGDTANRGATFEFSIERADRWKGADNIWLQGIFCYGYADDNLKVEKIDFEKRTFTLQQPHIYGVYDSYETTNNLALDAAKHQRSYFVYNLLEEIDMPGEWFLDNQTGKLYFWPPADITKASIELSTLSDPFLKLINTANLTIKGIGFKCSRGMGIFLRNIQSSSIVNCKFYNLGTVAISMGDNFNSSAEKLAPKGSPEFDSSPDTISQNILIDQCIVYNTGTGGIRLAGGNRKTLIAGNNRITNTEIGFFSRINKTYSAAIGISGAGNKVSNCYLHDAEHLAIYFSGNNHIIELNHFKNLAYNTSDMGAIYSGRNPSDLGNTIRYNFFDSILPMHKDNSICGIYIDDGSGGTRVYGNVFYKTGNVGLHRFGAININGGYGSRFSNNMFIHCSAAYSYNAWNDSGWVHYLRSPLIQSKMFSDVNVLSDAYLRQYPELKTYFDKVKIEDRKNFVENTAIVGDGLLTIGRGQNIFDCINTVRFTGDPGFVNAAKHNFGLKNNATLFSRLRGFEPIPFELIGVHRKGSNEPMRAEQNRPKKQPK